MKRFRRSRRILSVLIIIALITLLIANWNLQKDIDDLNSTIKNNNENIENLKLKNNRLENTIVMQYEEISRLKSKNENTTTVVDIDADNNEKEVSKIDDANNLAITSAMVVSLLMAVKSVKSLIPSF